MGRAQFQAKFAAILAFEARGPVHVGGRREGNVLYALRLPDGRLLVPGSTWKGAFRSIAEKLAPSIPAAGPEKLALELVAAGERGRDAYLEKLRGDFEAALKGAATRFDPADVKRVVGELGLDREASIDAREALEQYLEYYCPVGKLFGNRVRAGSLKFADSVVEAPTFRKPGVGIDRKTGTVKEGVLYFVEAGDPGAPVKLLMVGEVDERGSAASRLLASTLLYVKELGVAVGGKKSTGMGLLELRDARIHVVEYAADKGGAMLAQLLKTKPMGVEEFAAWLEAR